MKKRKKKINIYKKVRKTRQKYKQVEKEYYENEANTIMEGVYVDKTYTENENYIDLEGYYETVVTPNVYKNNYGLAYNNHVENVYKMKHVQKTKLVTKTQRVIEYLPRTKYENVKKQGLKVLKTVMNLIMKMKQIINTKHILLMNTKSINNTMVKKIIKKKYVTDTKLKQKLLRILLDMKKR